MMFEEKYFPCYILLSDQFYLSGWLILSDMYFVIISFPGYDIINFETNFIFLIKPFFLHDKKVMKKILWEYLENEKSL